jgi:hypothetical protein
MAIKTFTTGEVLTASDTNTFLANSGLVYVGSVTATNTTIALDNVFTTTFDSYKVVITTTNCNLTGTTLFRFRASGSPIATANYFYGGTVYFYNAAPSQWAAGSATHFPIIISSGAVECTSVIDLSFPRSATRKTFIAQATHNFSNYAGSTTHGFVDVSASTYDGLQITQDSGSTITGTITVYGYRKP